MDVRASLAAANQAWLAAAVKQAEDAGCDGLHLDLEDGVFVPNLTFGLATVRDLRPLTGLPFDVHLMVADPGRYVGQLARLGVRTVHVHLEACAYPLQELNAIRDLGMRAGLALNPRTPAGHLTYLLEHADEILIMTSEPDGRKQQFLPAMLEKVRVVRELVHRRPLTVVVDGGIGPDEGRAAARSGAAALVVGRAFFNAADPATMVAAIQRLEPDGGQGG